MSLGTPRLHDQPHERVGGATGPHTVVQSGNDRQVRRALALALCAVLAGCGLGPGETRGGDGAQLHVTDRNAFRPFQTGVEIIRMLRKLYPGQFAWKQPPYEYEHQKRPIQILLGGPAEDYFEE